MSVRPEDWPRVKALFHDALALTGGDRSAYIADACSGDVALRAEVERLLVSHDRAGGFLETPARSLRAADADASLTGRTLGTYRIERALGAGGMGEVYLAHDAKLDRPVAVKVLSSTRCATT